MKKSVTPKPERSLMYSFYDHSDTNWSFGKIRSRVDLIFETWSKETRSWRLVGSRTKLPEEDIMEMFRRVRGGLAQLVLNKYWKGR